MKKLLFASTALVLSTGVAAANNNISFSGDARMGVVYNNTAAVKTQFSSRARMTVRMTRTTDSGLQVGATFRIDQAGPSNYTSTSRIRDAAGLAPDDVGFDPTTATVTTTTSASGGATGNTNMTGGTVFISGEFGRLTMGDIAGAVQGAVGNLPNIGYSELRTGPQWLSNRSNGRTAVRYDSPNFNGFVVHLSSDQISASGGNGMAGIGMKYSFDGFSISAGYESGRTTDGNALPVGTRAEHWMIGAEAALDMVTLKALYGRAKDKDTNTSFSQYGVSAVANIDATRVTAYYMRSLNTTRNFGIGASYSLGGGAALAAGIDRRTGGGMVSRTRADLGITMSF